MTCTYDIVFAWENGSDQYIAHSSGWESGQKEFTIKATRSGSNGTDGTNHIANETEIFTALANSTNGKVVEGATISNNSESVATQNVWTIETKFYNLPGNQKELANKHYSGKFSVANVSCSAAGTQDMFVYTVYDNEQYDGYVYLGGIYDASNNTITSYPDEEDYDSNYVVRAYNSPEDAVLAFSEISKADVPIYLKHKIVDNQVDETYIVFIVRDEMVAEHPEMTAGSYTLIEDSDDNISTLTTAFGEENCGYNYGYYSCSVEFDWDSYARFSGVYYPNGETGVYSTNWKCVSGDYHEPYNYCAPDA